MDRLVVPARVRRANGWCCAAGWVPHIAVAIVLACPGATLGQIESAGQGTARALSIHYADGRTITRPLRDAGRMWTVAFPRIAGVDTSREGRPLSALHVSHEVDGETVFVTVALSYVSPNNKPVDVAKVRVDRGVRFRVDELRQFGVEPIELSLADVAVGLPLPAVASPSSMIDVRIDMPEFNQPIYRVVISNRSTHALMSLYLHGFRADRRALSTMKRGERNFPLIQPGGEYTFDVPMPRRSNATDSEPHSWPGLDRVVIIYVKWADGLIEGAVPSPDIEKRLYAARAGQLRRVLEVLRGAASRTPAALRAAIDAFGSSDAGRQQVDDALLKDLEDFERSHPPGDRAAFAEWLARTAIEYEQWLGRIVGP